MQKVLLLIFMVAAMFFVVSCGDDSEDEINSAIGGSCSLEGEKQCSGDSSQILVCNNSFWKAQTTCNLNFGQYCRQLENGEFSCTDNSNNENDNGENGNGGNNNGGNNDSGDSTDDSGDSGNDEGDSTDDSGDSDNDEGDSQPDGDDTDTSDSGDSQPDGDTDTSDSGDSGTCSDCDGTGVKITGTVTLFHPTAIPTSTYSALDGVQDGSTYWPPCETSVTLGEKSVYGTLTVNINTKHIATVAEMAALNGITGTESFIQVNHSFKGELGAQTFPKQSKGLTMSFFKTSKNSETGETETDLFIDDMDLINGNPADTYAIRMFCEGETVESGVKKIGVYNQSDCVFYVFNFATDSTDACWHALGVSDSDFVNDGLTFTVQ